VSQIVLVKQNPTEIPENDRAAARRVLFGLVDGLGDVGRKSWRRFINGLMKLEPGEMVEILTHKDRLGWYHRKHMALEQAVFEAQEKFDQFESFRTWLKVGSGYVDWYPGPKGGVIPVPRSLSYAKLEQGEMESVHEEMIKFLRTEHAGKTLWRHLSPAQRIDMIENLLDGFNE
jgi:hypothetical protein